MKHVTRIVWIVALALGLGTSPVRAFDTVNGFAATTAESTPALRAVDSSEIISQATSDDPFFIHPWDNPQRSDSLQSGGPVSGLRPFDEEHERHRPVDLGDQSAGKAGTIRPTAIDAVMNYPNPFNARTTIEFRLEAAGPVEIALFNLLGQTVRTMTFERLESGTQSWTWDGTLEGGRAAPSGIYFYRVSSGASSALRKMVLLK